MTIRLFAKCVFAISTLFVSALWADACQTASALPSNVHELGGGTFTADYDDTLTIRGGDSAYAVISNLSPHGVSVTVSIAANGGSPCTLSLIVVPGTPVMVWNAVFGADKWTIKASVAASDAGVLTLKTYSPPPAAGVSPAVTHKYLPEQIVETDGSSSTGGVFLARGYYEAVAIGDRTFDEVDVAVDGDNTGFKIVPVVNSDSTLTWTLYFDNPAPSCGGEAKLLVTDILINPMLNTAATSYSHLSFWRPGSSSGTSQCPPHTPVRQHLLTPPPRPWLHNNYGGNGVRG